MASRKAAARDTVADLMSTDVVNLHAGATVHEALRMMIDNRVSALPIVDQDSRCIGIVTTTDLVELTYDIDDDLINSDPSPSSQLRLVEKLSSSVGAEPIASYMSEQVVTVGHLRTLKEAAGVMLRQQVHHLPVVNDNEQLVGMLSTMDILAEFADE